MLPESIKKPLVSDVLGGYRKSTVTKDELNDLSCKTQIEMKRKMYYLNTQTFTWFVSTTGDGIITFDVTRPARFLQKSNFSY